MAGKEGDSFYGPPKESISKGPTNIGCIPPKKRFLWPYKHPVTASSFEDAHVNDGLKVAEDFPSQIDVDKPPPQIASAANPLNLGSNGTVICSSSKLTLGVVNQEPACSISSRSLETAPKEVDSGPSITESSIRIGSYVNHSSDGVAVSCNTFTSACDTSHTSTCAMDVATTSTSGCTRPIHSATDPSSAQQPGLEPPEKDQPIPSETFNRSVPIKFAMKKRLANIDGVNYWSRFGAASVNLLLDGVPDNLKSQLEAGTVVAGVSSDNLVNDTRAENHTILKTVPSDQHSGLPGGLLKVCRKKKIYNSTPMVNVNLPPRYLPIIRHMPSPRHVSSSGIVIGTKYAGGVVKRKRTPQWMPTKIKPPVRHSARLRNKKAAKTYLSKVLAGPAKESLKGESTSSESKDSADKTSATVECKDKPDNVADVKGTTVSVTKIKTCSEKPKASSDTGLSKPTKTVTDSAAPLVNIPEEISVAKAKTDSDVISKPKTDEHSPSTRVNKSVTDASVQIPKPAGDGDPAVPLSADHDAVPTKTGEFMTSKTKCNNEASIIKSKAGVEKSVKRAKTDCNDSVAPLKNSHSENVVKKPHGTDDEIHTVHTVEKKNSFCHDRPVLKEKEMAVAVVAISSSDVAAAEAGLNIDAAIGIDKKDNVDEKPSVSDSSEERDEEGSDGVAEDAPLLAHSDSECKEEHLVISDVRSLSNEDAAAEVVAMPPESPKHSECSAEVKEKESAEPVKPVSEKSSDSLVKHPRVKKGKKKHKRHTAHSNSEESANMEKVTANHSAESTEELFKKKAPKVVLYNGGGGANHWKCSLSDKQLLKVCKVVLDKLPDKMSHQSVHISNLPVQDEVDDEVPGDEDSPVVEMAHVKPVVHYATRPVQDDDYDSDPDKLVIDTGEDPLPQLSSPTVKCPETRKRPKPSPRSKKFKMKRRKRWECSAFKICGEGEEVESQSVVDVPEMQPVQNEAQCVELVPDAPRADTPCLGMESAIGDNDVCVDVPASPQPADPHTKVCDMQPSSPTATAEMPFSDVSGPQTVVKTDDQLVIKEPAGTALESSEAITPELEELPEERVSPLIVPAVKEKKKKGRHRSRSKESSKKRDKSSSKIKKEHHAIRIPGGKNLKIKICQMILVDKEVDLSQPQVANNIFSCQCLPHNKDCQLSSCKNSSSVDESTKDSQCQKSEVEPLSVSQTDQTQVTVMDNTPSPGQDMMTDSMPAPASGTEPEPTENEALTSSKTICDKEEVVSEPAPLVQRLSDGVSFSLKINSEVVGRRKKRKNASHKHSKTMCEDFDEHNDVHGTVEPMAILHSKTSPEFNDSKEPNNRTGSNEDLTESTDSIDPSNQRDSVIHTGSQGNTETPDCLQSHEQKASNQYAVERDGIVTRVAFQRNTDPAIDTVVLDSCSPELTDDRPGPGKAPKFFSSQRRKSSEGCSNVVSELTSRRKSTNKKVPSCSDNSVSQKAGRRKSDAAAQLRKFLSKATKSGVHDNAKTISRGHSRPKLESKVSIPVPKSKTPNKSEGHGKVPLGSPSADWKMAVMNQIKQFSQELHNKPEEEWDVEESILESQKSPVSDKVLTRSPVQSQSPEVIQCPSPLDVEERCKDLFAVPKPVTTDGSKETRKEIGGSVLLGLLTDNSVGKPSKATCDDILPVLKENNYGPRQHNSFVSPNYAKEVSSWMSDISDEDDNYSHKRHSAQSKSNNYDTSVPLPNNSSCLQNKVAHKSAAKAKQAYDALDRLSSKVHEGNFAVPISPAPHVLPAGMPDRGAPRLPLPCTGDVQVAKKPYEAMADSMIPCSVVVSDVEMDAPRQETPTHLSSSEHSEWECELLGVNEDSHVPSLPLNQTVSNPRLSSGPVRKRGVGKRGLRKEREAVVPLEKAALPVVNHVPAKKMDLYEFDHSEENIPVVVPPTNTSSVSEPLQHAVIPSAIPAYLSSYPYQSIDFRGRKPGTVRGRGRGAKRGGRGTGMRKKFSFEGKDDPTYMPVAARRGRARGRPAYVDIRQEPEEEEDEDEDVDEPAEEAEEESTPTHAASDSPLSFYQPAYQQFTSVNQDDYESVLDDPDAGTTSDKHFEVDQVSDEAFNARLFALYRHDRFKTRNKAKLRQIVNFQNTDWLERSTGESARSGYDSKEDSGGIISSDNLDKPPEIKRSRKGKSHRRHRDKHRKRRRSESARDTPSPTAHIRLKIKLPKKPESPLVTSEIIEIASASPGSPPGLQVNAPYTDGIEPISDDDEPPCLSPIHMPQLHHPEPPLLHRATQLPFKDSLPKGCPLLEGESNSPFTGIPTDIDNHDHVAETGQMISSAVSTESESVPTYTSHLRVATKLSSHVSQQQVPSSSSDEESDASGNLTDPGLEDNYQHPNFERNLKELYERSKKCKRKGKDLVCGEGSDRESIGCAVRSNMSEMNKVVEETSAGLYVPIHSPISSEDSDEGEYYSTTNIVFQVEDSAYNSDVNHSFSSSLKDNDGTLSEAPSSVDTGNHSTPSHESQQRSQSTELDMNWGIEGLIHEALALSLNNDIEESFMHHATRAVDLDRLIQGSRTLFADIKEQSEKETENLVRPEAALCVRPKLEDDDYGGLSPAQPLCAMVQTEDAVFKAPFAVLDNNKAGKRAGRRRKSLGSKSPRSFSPGYCNYVSFSLMEDNSMDKLISQPSSRNIDQDSPNAHYLGEECGADETDVENGIDDMLLGRRRRLSTHHYIGLTGDSDERESIWSSVDNAIDLSW